MADHDIARSEHGHRTIESSAASARDSTTLRDLRKMRREIRLGDIEWFDIAYRVYLFALFGVIAVVLASDAVNGLIDDGASTDQILRRGPSLAGIAVAFAFGIGLRNGADGGPVSIEAADVRHILLSPVSRWRVLLRPIAQRVRSVAFGFALTLAVLGQLVGREIEGSRAAWAASSALFGALVAVIYVGTAIIAHAIRVPPAVASAAAAVVGAWQITAAWRTWDDDARDMLRLGPGNLVGSILFWGIRVRPIDLAAVVAVVVLLALAFGLGGRLRLEPLERRGQLVSQLRFAATVQDIRTVVLLRRQLRAETLRSRPWLARRTARTSQSRPVQRPTRGTGDPDPRLVWKRGINALLRLPAGRVIRIVGLAAAAGAAASLSVTTTPLLLIAFVIAAFVVGLESLEPLAQEIDRPDLTDMVPVDRGWLYANHLVAPSVLLAIAGITGSIAAIAVEPDHFAAALALGVPLAWVGAIGAVVTTVGDAPEAPGVAGLTMTGAPRGTESPFALPEFAGFGQVGSGALPLVFSALAALPILALRVEPAPSTVWRSLVGVALCLAMTAWWIVRRDQWAVSVRNFFRAGRAESGLTGGAST